jgi:hypothetical protein
VSPLLENEISNSNLLCWKYVPVTGVLRAVVLYLGSGKPSPSYSIDPRGYLLQNANIDASFLIQEKVVVPPAHARQVTVACRLLYQVVYELDEQ